MTDTSTSIEIAAPPAAIYRLAADTARWPLFLPHYRYVRVRKRDGPRQVVEMAAWRHIFALRWIAEQENDPAHFRIAFRHLAGPTPGMAVEWTLQPGTGQTRVTIAHRLEFAFPVLAARVEKDVVAGYFVEGVARQTLAHLKIAVEAAGR